MDVFVPEQRTSDEPVLGEPKRAWPPRDYGIIHQRGTEIDATVDQDPVVLDGDRIFVPKAKIIF